MRYSFRASSSSLLLLLTSSKSGRVNGIFGEGEGVKAGDGITTTTGTCYHTYVHM